MFENAPGPSPPLAVMTEPALKLKSNSPHMMALALVAAIVGLIWVAVAIRFGGRLGGSVGVVLLGVCAGWFLFHIDLGPISMTTDRAAACALCS